MVLGTRGVGSRASWVPENAMSRFPAKNSMSDSFIDKMANSEGRSCVSREIEPSHKSIILDLASTSMFKFIFRFSTINESVLNKGGILIQPMKWCLHQCLLSLFVAISGCFLVSGGAHC